MKRDVFYELVEKMQENDEGIKNLEDAIGGCVDLNGKLFAVLGWMPFMVQSEANVKEWNDDTEDAFYEQFWGVVNADIDPEEFYDEWMMEDKKKMSEEDFYALVKKMRANDTALTDWEGLLGGADLLDTDIARAFTYVPELLEKIFLKGYEDKELNEYYAAFWDMIGGDVDVDEFYQRWIAK